MKSSKLCFMIKVVFTLLAFSKTIYGQCPNSNWQEFGGSCYLFINELFDYSEAQAHCAQIAGSSGNGKLATITSAELNAFIFNEVEAWSGTWIGLRRGKDDQFRWDDGEDIVYANWHPSEPNDFNNEEDCGEMGIEGKWNDIPCRIQRSIACTASIDADECAGGNTNNCGPNADCQNTYGSFTCTCRDGFNGDGITCTDADECADGNTNNCDPNADCQNTDGSFTCTCRDGFNGDGITCTGELTVECKSNSIEVRAPSNYFTAKGIALSDLHLLDHTCVGVVDTESANTWLFTIPSFSSCSTNSQTSDTQLTYSNRLSNLGQNNIYTGEAYSAEFSCRYERTFDDVSLISSGYQVVHSITSITSPDVEGSFTIAMNPYSDGTFATPSTKTTYEPTERIYIQVFALSRSEDSRFRYGRWCMTMVDLGTTNDDLNLVFDRCWVTPTSQSDGDIQHDFVSNQCPVGGGGNVEITRSGNGNLAQLSSQVFAFADSETAFMHCSLSICVTTTGTNCIPSCLNQGVVEKRSILQNLSSRVRRQAVNITNEEIVSLGPFFLVQGPPPAVKEDGMSTVAIVGILVAGVIVILGLLAFIAFWFRGSRRRQRNKDLDVVTFTNHAMSKE